MREPFHAVVFDAYGTLVEIADKRDPYRRLFTQWANAVKSVDRLTPLKSKTSLQSLSQGYLLKVPDDAMAALEADLAAEVASVRAFDDVAPVWTELRKRGIRIGICSNLATPYIQPVLDALPFPPDAACWSCECGMVKDDPHIYLLMCARLGVHVSRTLMVGDSHAKDVLGPAKVGMHAMHLRRSEPVSTAPGLGSLYDLLRLAEPMPHPKEADHAG